MGSSLRPPHDTKVRVWLGLGPRGRQRGVLLSLGLWDGCARRCHLDRCGSASALAQTIRQDAAEYPSATSQGQQKVLPETRCRAEVELPMARWMSIAPKQRYQGTRYRWPTRGSVPIFALGTPLVE